MIDINLKTDEYYDELVRILGEEYIHKKVSSPFDFIYIANEGINANVIKNFRAHFEIPLDFTAQLLNISEPTIYRWTKKNKILDSHFSVKLFEIVDLFLYGIRVFQGKDNFFKWFELPNTSIGGMEPQELAEFPDGISKIRDVLGRIEYGVYS